MSMKETIKNGLHLRVLIFVSTELITVEPLLMDNENPSNAYLYN